MRKINKLIIHCSATREGEDIDAATIKRWHLRRGWKDIGYHFIIRLDGTIELGRMIDVVGSHTKGENTNSIGICYIGGVENFRTDGEYKAKDTRTEKQKASIITLLRALKLIYKDASIHGHREFANKACPSFDAAKEYKNLKLNTNDGLYINKLASVINWLYGLYKNYSKSNSYRKG
tara:strand:- start:821 stop:1351 length:531 start_codon:yes stop_codon:yes gene_type:complete